MDGKLSIISGWRNFFIWKRIQLFVLLEAFKLLHNPFRTLAELRRMSDFGRAVKEGGVTAKCVKSGKRYFSDPDYCGFPSRSFRNLIRSEYENNPRPVMKTLVWGITNRCPLSCEHCYEWDNISKIDKLDLKSLRRILRIFRSNGLSHIQFSGGEPLVRFNDLLELVKDASTTMDCWLLTSGYGLTFERAVALKEAGLTGAHISLDHWDEQKHNLFRNNAKSFQMATEGLKNCIKAGIMGSFSLCATREFVSEENLMKYANLAKDLGANFIRIVEPRATGRFSGRNIQLESYHINLISGFASRMNREADFKDYPIISFYGGFQRKIGCIGAGNRYIYADPNGEVHACPFCRTAVGNLLTESFEELIRKVRSAGCHQFQNYSNMKPESHKALLSSGS